MKILKEILKAFFWLMILALLVLPLGLLYKVSNGEMKAYETPESPVVREVSAGAPKAAVRMDVKEFVTVSGAFTCGEMAFQELDYWYPSEIRWLVSAGDEITEGQTLGYYRGDPVTAQQDGILEEISTFDSSNAYLKIRCFGPLTLEAQVDGKVLSSLQRGQESLTLEDGSAVSLDYASQVKTAKGETTVWFTLEDGDYAYGQEVKDLKIYTGGGYPQVLVLSADCVYQKEKGEGNPWYARRVTEDGYFEDEVQVTISYRSGDMVCVSGVSEGDWFDSGYKAIIEGSTDQTGDAQ